MVAVAPHFRGTVRCLEAALLPATWCEGGCLRWRPPLSRFHRACSGGQVPFFHSSIYPSSLGGGAPCYGRYRFIHSWGAAPPDRSLAPPSLYLPSLVAVREMSAPPPLALQRPDPPVTSGLTTLCSLGAHLGLIGYEAQESLAFSF